MSFNKPTTSLTQGLEKLNLGDGDVNVQCDNTRVENQTIATVVQNITYIGETPADLEKRRKEEERLEEEKRKNEEERKKIEEERRKLEEEKRNFKRMRMEDRTKEKKNVEDVEEKGKEEKKKVKAETEERTGQISGQRLIPLPKIAKKDWASTAQWPVGFAFVAQPVRSEIFVWGGAQEDDRIRHVNHPLPLDTIFALHVETFQWRQIKATGDIPPRPSNADVLYKDMIYIFGGAHTNNIFCLSPTSGIFLRLPVVGPRPSLRNQLRGWSHHREAKLFFFAGNADEAKGDGSLVGDQRKSLLDFIAFDNLLCCIDLVTNKWSKPKTRGTSPSPRRSYAAATIAHQVMIHGGFDGSILNDTHMLDMESMTWTLISTGGPRVMSHSLSPLALKRFLLVGGVGENNRTEKEVWIFDLSDFTWKRREESLPANMNGHGAVVTKSSKGLSVVCLGGYLSDMKNMVVFDVE